MIVKYLLVFVFGGLICVVGQLLINYTKLTTARILIIYLVAGVLLTALGVYDNLIEFAGAAFTVPIMGFGYTLAKGAIQGAESGLLEALLGGVINASAGITAAVVFSYLAGIICRSRTKKI